MLSGLQMQKYIFTLFLLLSISSCSLLDPLVYKLPIQQGDIVNQEQIDKLREDMTKDQVKFVLGTPLVTDAFNPDHWIYLYLLNNQDGDQKQQRLEVFFEDGRLKDMKSKDFKLHKVFPEKYPEPEQPKTAKK